jgi:hypothetical protein
MMLSVLRNALRPSALARVATAASLTPLQRKLSNGPSHIKTAQAFENISGNNQYLCISVLLCTYIYGCFWKLRQLYNFEYKGLFFRSSLGQLDD